MAVTECTTMEEEIDAATVAGDLDEVSKCVQGSVELLRLGSYCDRETPRAILEQAHGRLVALARACSMLRKAWPQVGITPGLYAEIVGLARPLPPNAPNSDTHSAVQAFINVAAAAALQSAVPGGDAIEQACDRFVDVCGRYAQLAHNSTGDVAADVDAAEKELRSQIGKTLNRSEALRAIKVLRLAKERARQGRAAERAAAPAAVSPLAAESSQAEGPDWVFVAVDGHQYRQLLTYCQENASAGLNESFLPDLAHAVLNAAFATEIKALQKGDVTTKGCIAAYRQLREEAGTPDPDTSAYPMPPRVTTPAPDDSTAIFPEIRRRLASMCEFLARERPQWTAFDLAKSIVNGSIDSALQAMRDGERPDDWSFEHWEKLQAKYRRQESQASQKGSRPAGKSGAGRGAKHRQSHGTKRLARDQRAA